MILITKYLLIITYIFNSSNNKTNYERFNHLNECCRVYFKE